MNVQSGQPFGRHRQADWSASPLLRALLVILHRLERGSLEIVIPDGRMYRAAGREPGPNGRIAIAHPQFLRRLFREGHLGFGEMFMDGWWSTPDLQALLDVIMLNNRTVGLKFPGAGLFRLCERLRHLLRANTRKGSRRNIAYHYDLGNDFYALWLDETMTYSSALFRNPGERLADAQRNKYAAICDRIAPAAGSWRSAVAGAGSRNMPSASAVCGSPASPSPGSSTTTRAHAFSRRGSPTGRKSCCATTVKNAAPTTPSHPSK